VGASLGATERDEFLRCAWRVGVAAGVGAERFVFVDECGANVTLRASMSLEGMGPCLAVEGPTTKAVF
jgi:hypothetical protein